MLGKVGHGIGGFFGNFASIFGGFFANGDDITPGKAYMVGERGPELIMPKAASTVIPAHALMSGSGQATSITFHQHIHGVTDADSFKRSQAQISSAMGMAVSRGQMRNGR